MKKILILIAFIFFCLFTVSAQIIVEKGNLKVGLSVSLDGRILPIDSLCQGFDSATNLPIDLVAPEGSSVQMNSDSITATSTALILNNREPSFINQPAQTNRGFSMSASAGSTNSYTFIDQDENDSLKIEWMVGYNAIELIDLYPADYFTDYISYTFKNVFEEYPDTARYNWSEVEYIQELDEIGIPIAPTFPHNHKGLLFVIYITEDAFVQMRGYHEDFQQLDIDNPFDLLLYDDLASGTYEFVAKPYEEAPESLWLKYPFTIEKPWWQKGKFQFLIGAVFFSLLTATIVLLVLGRQKRKEKELRWQQQITDAELKAIRAQLNPHFLFNALNSIQNLVTQQKTEQANTYITKLSRLLRQVLSSSERQFQELEDELQLNQLYLEIEQLRFPFKLQIDVANTVDRQTLVPVMLLQPYLENAVKHGIAGNPEGEIIIKIEGDEKNLDIEILDNGPGLTSPKSNSKGLALGSNRIQHLNNLYAGEATVKVNDRVSTSGVVVKISLPLA